MKTRPIAALSFHHPTQLLSTKCAHKERERELPRSDEKRVSACRERERETDSDRAVVNSDFADRNEHGREKKVLVS